MRISLVFYTFLNGIVIHILLHSTYDYITTVIFRSMKLSKELIDAQR